MEAPLLAAPNLAAPRNVPPTPVKIHTTPRIAQPQTDIREPPMTAASDRQQMVRQPDQLDNLRKSLRDLQQPDQQIVAGISGNFRKPAPTTKEHGKYMTSHVPAYPARCNKGPTPITQNRFAALRGAEKKGGASRQKYTNNWSWGRGRGISLGSWITDRAARPGN